MRKYLQFIYLIVPVVLLGLFSVTYVHHQKEAAALQMRLAEEQRIKDEKARQEQEELEKRLEAEAKAVAAAKAKALKEKEEAEEKERQERFDELRGRLKATQDDLGRLTGTVDDLKVKIEAEKTARKTAEDDAFNLGVEVEKLRARKASLDLEVQRLTNSIVERFETSWRNLTEMPAPTK